MAVGETVGLAMLFWDAINEIAQKEKPLSPKAERFFFSEAKLPDQFRPSALFCEELPLLLLLSGFLLGLLLRGLLLLYGLLLFLGCCLLFGSLFLLLSHSSSSV